MNEFDLQGLEREIQAWRRRLESHDAPLIRAELNDIARDVGALRSQARSSDESPGPSTSPDGARKSEPEFRQSVEQRLFHLLSLYDAGPGSKNLPRGSA